MSAYTTETLQDFESINPDIGQVSMPKDLTQAFSNAVAVNPDQALMPAAWPQKIVAGNMRPPKA